MAHITLNASHSIVGSKVGHFQSAIVDAILAEVDAIGPYPEEAGGGERHFQIESSTLQGLQRSFDEYESILIVRIVEIFIEKAVVQGYCIVVRDAVLADACDGTISEAIQRAVSAAGEADAYATVSRATINTADRNPYENLMDEVRRVQENEKENSDESATE